MRRERGRKRSWCNRRREMERRDREGKERKRRLNRR